MTELSHTMAVPSAWVRRCAQWMRPGGTVLDVACGRGRHVRWLAAQGFAVTGVDRDADALHGLQGIATTVQADLEGGAPWPLPGQQFDAVLVANYLWRPLFSALLGSVAAGGLLVYETFAAGNETVGRPARPEFLLQPGELLQLFAAAGPHWQVIAYENGYEPQPPRFVQRIAAVRAADHVADSVPRYSLLAAQG